MFKLEGIIVGFTDEFYDLVATQAVEQKTGARGLRNNFLPQKDFG